MRRASFAVLAWAGLAAWPAVAHADYYSTAPGATAYEDSYHSPQHFAAELKFGMYSPNIDATKGLTGHPFSDLFNPQDGGKNLGKRPPGKLLTSLEFDWQFFHKFGSLGLAASWGISQRSTHSFLYNQNVSGQSCTVPNCIRSSDETTLDVMPFALEVVYRFDVLALRYKVPLIPYFKGGIGYYLWWITNGNGDLAFTLKDNKPTGDKAYGGTFGLVLHPGIALLLDILDPTSARVMDAELGINHSFIFVEMHYAWITGFNIGDRMNLSDLEWNAGVGFEF